MRSQNRLVFIIVICLIIAAAFTYFNQFADRGRRIDSQPREILPRGDLAEFERSTININRCQHRYHFRIRQFGRHRLCGTC